MGKPVECPQCTLRLWVAKDAEGKITTCPECMNEFVVAAETDPLADTEAIFKETALMDVADASDFADSIVDDWMNDESGMADPPAVEKSDDESKVAEADEAGGIDEALKLALAEAQALNAPQAPASEKPKAISTDVSNKPAATPQPAPKPSPPSPPGSVGADRQPETSQPVNDPYDRIDPGSIRLSIQSLDMSNVLMEFPNWLLELDAFRASFPMQCLGCGESDSNKLLAKPLPWVDKYPSRISAREFSDRFARNVPRNIGPIEFVKDMHLISDMPMPFGLQMPFYVCKDKCDRTIEITTKIVSSPYGVGCQVRLPVGAGALEWMARVNGVCGRDYLQLASMVQRHKSTEWEAIPEKQRQRLANWFQWAEQEKFLIYLSDSDFAKKDEGLAGLVLTDKRIVFRKYQRQGVIPLGREGTLQFKEEQSFCEVSHRTSENQITQMVRLRRENAQIFKLLLEGVETRLKVQDL